MDSVFIKVPVSERRPNSSGHYYTDKGKQRFNVGTGMFSSCKSGVTEYWFEEINLPTEPKELANTLLVNAIVGLDKEGAKGLVRELCERFGLIPTDEEMFDHAMVVECKEDEELDAFRDGASFILNHIKGG